MSQESMDVVRRLGALATEGDWDAAVELLAPDVEWVVAREHPEARTLVGREAASAYLRDWQETLLDMRIEPERILACDDKVVGIGTIRGTGAGSEAYVQVPIAVVYTFRGALVARLEEYLNPSEALRQVGLAE